MTSAGTFSAAVPLTLGANTLTAQVTSNGGATKTASETVNYTGPAPAVTTGRASHVESSTAKVSGTVISGASGGTYYFQYGRTICYGHQTAAKALAAGASTVSVSAGLSRLASHSGYHYRLVASNRGGTSYGSDHTFKTLYALRAMTVGVIPHHALVVPYHFTILGSLKAPMGLKRKQACSGTVTVTIKHGRRKIGSHRVKVTKTCSYVAKGSLRLKGHGKLTCAVTFNGNKKVGTYTHRAVTALFG